MKTLKAEIAALNAKDKAKTELLAIYELGKQSALNGDSIDNKPRYRKQNKVAAWLQGFADGKHEKEQRELNRSVDKAGIAKLKEIMQQAFAEK